ncbi:hypothetical protein AB6813_11845 [bacterium RCC_150]
MGKNLPWIFVLLVPSLGFFFYLIFVNIRVTLRRKALGLPPLGLSPRRLRNRRRKKIKYVAADDPEPPGDTGNTRSRTVRPGRVKRSLSWARRHKAEPPDG